jgi:hypothetical protein
MNLYGAQSTTYGVPVLLVEYIAHTSNAYKLSTLIGWGDTPAEFEVFVNDEPCAGGRSSDQYRTVQVWWEDSMYINPGDNVAVVATHYSQGLLNLKCNLIMKRI